jgi:hypothetical protein
VTILLLFLLGTVGFVAITYFEQLPVLGWTGAIVSVVAWLTIARETARASRDAVMRTGVWAAILGAWTGLVGAVTAWALQTGNLFGFSTEPYERVGAGFGFVGATLGLFYWPVIGAGVCFAFALYFSSRRFEEWSR